MFEEEDGLIKVFIVEDFGERYWVWTPGVQEETLINWWRSLQEVSSISNVESWQSSSGFPGNLRRASPDEASSCRFKFHIHEDDDSWLYMPEKNKIFHHAGFEG